jgi:hypothetical protein
MLYPLGKKSFLPCNRVPACSNFAEAKPKPVTEPVEVTGRDGGRSAAEDIGQADISKIMDTSVTYSYLPTLAGTPPELLFVTLSWLQEKVSNETKPTISPLSLSNNRK